jgi:hypothetical protein
LVDSLNDFNNVSDDRFYDNVFEVVMSILDKWMAEDELEDGKYQYGTGKLTQQNVLKIRKLLTDGVSEDDLAKRYNVTRAHISKIHRRKTWKNI